MIQRTITEQEIKAAKVEHDFRLDHIREAIRHLNLALQAYEYSESGEDYPHDGSVVGMFEAPDGPISLSAAHDAIVCAALGRPQD